MTLDEQLTALQETMKELEALHVLYRAAYQRVERIKQNVRRAIQDPDGAEQRDVSAGPTVADPERSAGGAGSVGPLPTGMPGMVREAVPGERTEDRDGFLSIEKGNTING